MKQKRICPWCKKPIKPKKDERLTVTFYQIGCYNEACEVNPHTWTFTSMRECYNAWDQMYKI